MKTPFINVKAIHKIDAKAFHNGILPGARTSPAQAVNTTKLITLGFIRAKKSEGLAKEIPDVLKATSLNVTFGSILFILLLTSAHRFVQYEVTY